MAVSPTGPSPGLLSTDLGVDRGPDESWEKKRKEKGLPGCPGSTSGVTGMSWRVPEIYFV